MNKIIREFLPANGKDVLETANQNDAGNEVAFGIVIDNGLDFLIRTKKILQSGSKNFLFVLNLDQSVYDDDRSIQELVRQLIHYIVDVNYFSFCGKKIFVIKSTASDFREVACIRHEFSKLGLHDIYFMTCGAKLNDPLTDSIKLSPDPGTEPNTKALFQFSNWFFVKSDAIVEQERTAAEHSGQLEKDLANLRVSYYDAISEIDVLKKNLYDLNKYYRYVRGETNFKYSNRQEEGHSQQVQGSPIPAADLVAFVNSTAAHPDDFSALKKYQEQYERLPGVYKKIGTFLKIITGKTPYMRHFSKRHKNTFINFLGFLPEDKRVEAWYYYEYEVLPAWYKNIGSWYMRSSKRKS